MSYTAPMVEVDHQLQPLNGGTGKFIYSLRALGRNGLPATFDLEGTHYVLERALKHDFYAATGIYHDGAGRKVILKMGRDINFFGIPTRWIGRRLCAREIRFYAHLADLPNVPRVLGRVGVTGFVHTYVNGGQLSRDRRIPDGYFDELNRLFHELHRRDIAYVDTNKPQNILVGDDGRPYLIDFQISYDLQTFGDHFLSRWLMTRAKREDCYHILKHKRRFRPDEMTPEEQSRSRRVSRFIRVYRCVTKPYFVLRRALFKRLRESGRLLPEGSK